MPIDPGSVAERLRLLADALQSRQDWLGVTTARKGLKN
jgi:hypothetical protein